VSSDERKGGRKVRLELVDRKKVVSMSDKKSQVSRKITSSKQAESVRIHDLEIEFNRLRDIVIDTARLCEVLSLHIEELHTWKDRVNKRMLKLLKLLGKHAEGIDTEGENEPGKDTH
jgi:hypothetical protein